MQQKAEIEEQRKRTRSFQLRYELTLKRNQEQFWTRVQNKMIEDQMNEFYEGAHHTDHVNDEDPESQSLLRANREEEKVAPNQVDNDMSFRRLGANQNPSINGSQEIVRDVKSQNRLNFHTLIKAMKEFDKNEKLKLNSKLYLEKYITRKVNEKEKIEEERDKIQDVFEAQVSSPLTNVMMPKYEFSDAKKLFVETEIPPPSLYIGLGYNPTHESEVKHYRKYYEDELENVKSLMPRSPFKEYKIYRGQSRGLSKSWFFTDNVDEAGQVSTLKEVGKFKAIISVKNLDKSKDHTQAIKPKLEELKHLISTLYFKLTNEEFNFDYSQLDLAEGREKFTSLMKKINCRDLNIQNHLMNISYNEYLNRALLKKSKCIVRVYIISAFDLAKRDNGSHSDPYIILKLNKDTVNERDEYQQDQPNPGIYKHYDFEAVFPGCSPLKIQFWDQDSIFGDDLIGETKIDLEDRFFCPEWQSITNKPVEYRQLYHPSSKVSQGVVKMWLEIHPIEIKKELVKIWDITPRPEVEFEVRVVIWETEGITTYDWEGTSDIYIRSFIDNTEHAKVTDTHWRCQDGKGSFNYRLKFTVTNPGTSGILSLQAWDKDIFKSNDFIADSSLNL